MGSLSTSEWVKDIVCRNVELESRVVPRQIVRMCASELYQITG